MARKESITRELLIKGAFDLVREQGGEMLTARKLASYLGCSTQPIFRIFDGMDELSNEIFMMAKDFYEQYCMSFRRSNVTPFVDLALCYISFAKEETNLFKLLFLAKHDSDNTMYDIINGKENALVIRELKRIPRLDMNNAGMIFMKVFIFMHGLACMVTNGEYDLDDDATITMLTQVITSFIV